MTDHEFVMLVKKMRDTQKLYFKQRSRDVMMASIELEKMVDAELATLLPAEGQKEVSHE